MLAIDQSTLSTALFGLTSTCAYAYYRYIKDLESKSNTSYFKPKKNLAMKDQLIIKMLEENEIKADGKLNGAICYVITDPDLADNPIIHSSSGFCKFTQYSKGEIEGKNCRFLQGKDTNAKDVKLIREAVKEKKETSVCLLNYKKDGTPFVNQFFLCPLFDDNDKIAYYLGVQAEVAKKEPMQEGANMGWRIFMWL